MKVVSPIILKPYHPPDNMSSINLRSSGGFKSIENNGQYDVNDALTINAWIKPLDNEYGDGVRYASIINLFGENGVGYRLNIRDNGEIWAQFGTGHL